MGEFIKDVFTRIAAQFQPEVLGESLAGFMANMLVAIVIFLAFYLLWRLLNLSLNSVIKKSGVDATSASFLKTALKFAVLTLGVVQALAAAGINTGAVLTSLGIAGLTIGFAARDALSNLISGLLIFWDRPFVIGDLVEVEGRYGRVSEITLRSTRVVTVDGQMLAVPNSTIINTTVSSYTNFPHLRLDIDITIGTAEDIDRVRKILLALVVDDPNFVDEPKPRVVVTALNDYNTAIALQAWIEDERQHIRLRFDLRERAFKALTAAGVDMPLETLQLAPVTVNEARA